MGCSWIPDGSGIVRAAGNQRRLPMATDRDDKSEKGTRSKGVDHTESEREAHSRSADYADDDYNDLGGRARQNARDFGESVREAGRSVRREGTDVLSGYC